MACCAVAAYIVFRFLSVHEKLFASLRPKIPHNTVAHENVPYECAQTSVQSHTQSCILNLGGLTCATCVGDVQNAIEGVPGVVRVSVSLALLRAHVAFTHPTSEETIVKIIRDAGYDASPLTTAHAPDDWGQLPSAIQKPLSSRAHDAELWRRNFGFSVVASVLMAFTSYIPTQWDRRAGILLHLARYLAVAAALAAGSRIHIETLGSIWHLRKPNMSTLASLGMLLALIQAAALNASRNKGPLYWIDDAALEKIPVLSTSILGGRLLKAVMSQHSLDFASPLLGLQPEKAIVYCNQDGKNTTSVLSSMISPGDRLLVKEGERLAADGIVESQGESLVSESWMTGSSTPRTVRGGEHVYAGSTVLQGELIVVASSTGKSTRLSRVLSSIVSAESASAEPASNRLVQQFSTVVISLVVAFVVVQYHGFNASLQELLGKASTMLLAACPCALSLSVPTCKLFATVSASKAGIKLATSSARIKAAADARVVLFDKTGTLTQGSLRVAHASLSPNKSIPLDIIWKSIRKVETGIQHPAAQAIIQEGNRRVPSRGNGLSDSDSLAISELNHKLGRGVEGRVNVTGNCQYSFTIAVGSRKYMNALGVSVDLSGVPENFRSALATPVVVAIDGVQAAVLILEDTVRSDAPELITVLKKRGLKVGMLTGDSYASAIVVAKQVGIDAEMVFADCLPEEKANVVKKFQNLGPAMVVGDNINDLPCFAAASFSICAPSHDSLIGTMSGPADATLLPDIGKNRSTTSMSMKRILFMMRLSRKFVEITQQNMWWAAAYNTVALIWATGLLHNIVPSSTTWAAFSMGLSSVFILWNSGRIKRQRMESDG